MKEELKFALIEFGGPCVEDTGGHPTATWSVNN